MPDTEIADAFVAVVGAENGGATDLHVENGSAMKQQPGHAAITYRDVKAHLAIQAPKAVEAITFYKKAFGAEEVTKLFHPKRKADQEQLLVMHAHLKFGGAEIIVFDETEEAGSTVKSPATLNGTSLLLYLETNDVDAALVRAVEAGATVEEEASDRVWGRSGRILDPYGFAWSLNTPLLKEATAIAEEPVEAGQAA